MGVISRKDDISRKDAKAQRKDSRKMVSSRLRLFSKGI
jgi:hypothetical protein